MRSTLLVLAALATLAATGCNQGSGFVHGDVLQLTACDELDEPKSYTPFDMNLLFLGLARQNDLVLVRSSPSTMLQGDADEIMLVFDDVDDIMDTLASGAGPVVLPIEADGPVQLGLALNHRCDIVVDSLVGVGGELALEAVGTLPGDRFAATFEFDLVDARTGATAGLGFVGELDFSVEVNLPFQVFLDQPSRVGL